MITMSYKDPEQSKLWYRCKLAENPDFYKHRRIRRQLADPKYLEKESRLSLERRKQSKRDHPEKNRARKALYRAVASGRLIRPEVCSSCGEEPEPSLYGTRTAVHGHHEDYSKPLDVIWLCQGCHARVHR